MENRLTVYSEDTYEEYRLAWRGAEFCEIVLPRERFGAPGELRLKLENRDGTPAFLPSGAFSLRPARGRRRFPLPAGEGGLYFLTPNGGGRLVLLWETERTPAVRCFAPGPENRLSIGSAPENQFVYDRGNAVSEVHAVFTWTEGGCLLEDRSCNGVYVNGRRVRGSQPLAPGDRVHLCGLTAVYTGNGVALDSSTPGLQVREDAVILEDVPEAFAAGRFLDSEEPIVVQMKNATKTVDSVQFQDHSIYAHGQVVSPITDYYLDMAERDIYLSLTLTAVKSRLEIPETAVFPSKSSWEYTMGEGTQVTVRSTVTCRDASGKEEERTFVAYFEDGAFVSLEFEGEEE